MCQALTNLTSAQDSNPQLLDTRVSALASAYQQDDMATPQSVLACTSVLRYIGLLALKGYLKGAMVDTVNYYAELTARFTAAASAFVHRKDNTSISENKRKDDLSIQLIAKYVQVALIGLTEGTLNSMVAGQDALTVKVAGM